MLPYFPLTDNVYKMALGVQALNPAPLIEIDPLNYQAEIDLKQEILQSDYPYYFNALPETEAMQWETLELLLPELAAHYPKFFDLKTEGEDWVWHNRLLDTELNFRLGARESLPLPPLDWLGRQLQEDLLIMDGRVEGIPLVAGQLCFPNDWCLEDKIGKSFMEIHQPVPLFAEQIGQSSYLMMERLKSGRPVWRINWGIKPSKRLNLATKFKSELQNLYRDITLENVGKSCYFRIERQGLLRLPRTGGVLFTIRTYQTPLEILAQKPEQTNLLYGVLKTMPSVSLEYKGMAPFIEILLEYFENKTCQESK